MNTPTLSSKDLRAAATRAANKILAAGGYDHKGTSLKAAEKRKQARKAAKKRKAKR